jgi:hypothetical protein
MFEIFRSTTGGFYWRLKASNGEVLCHSEVYISKQSAQNGINAVKHIAAAAPTYDHT